MSSKTISVFFIFIMSFFGTFANAQDIELSQKNSISILEHSEVYITDQDDDLQNIIDTDKFKPYTKEFINVGVTQNTVWIHFKLHNRSHNTLNKILVPSSPLLENITLYPAEDTASPIHSGMTHTAKNHNTIPYIFNIEIEANSSKSYYMQIKSVYSPVNFELTLEEEESFLQNDKVKQAINILLTGVLVALMVYAFLLSFYIKDKSYFYYALYLLALVYQQMTYLGLTQLFMPQIFITLDMSIVLIKVVLLISSSALYAMHFLDTSKLPVIDKIYKFIIIVSLFELLLLEAEDPYSLTIVIVTGAVFITFNMIAGVISYLHGRKQARLFLLGFGIVFLTYMAIILDALGVTSVMLYFNSALIWTTALEAFILSLAFADRYVILQEEKRSADKFILEESKNRTERIQKEVFKKTNELNQALETKELLLKEIHHRVKNNLQIILSIVRLQSDEIDDPDISEKLINLEHRINAISKTYTMLLITDDLGNIDMEKYIDVLLEDIAETCNAWKHKISIKTDISAVIPLKESVYVGLIVNELVVNAYKYAFDDNEGTISVSMKKRDGEYLLMIEDSGKGFIISKTNSLGLKLIHTLIYNQLEGTMDIDTNAHTQYTIRFKI